VREQHVEGEGRMSKPQVVAIKVKFTLNAKNGLRRVVFGLEKETNGELVKWMINFQLFEREKKTVEFGDAMVDLDIEVDQKFNKQAESVAKNGLSAGQAAFALGPAAEDAKAGDAGEIPKEDAQKSIQSTLTKK
jgi:hypothetical protein